MRNPVERGIRAFADWCISFCHPISSKVLMQSIPKIGILICEDVAFCEHGISGSALGIQQMTLEGDGHRLGSVGSADLGEDDGQVLLDAYG